jgi:hypothetical protein
MSDLTKLAERWKAMARDVDHLWPAASSAYLLCARELRAALREGGLPVMDIFEEVAARRMTPREGANLLTRRKP